jgi:DNA-binding NarL/FixJ family response regulator
MTMYQSASLYAGCLLELVPLYQPHVVLMHFYMPRMNGVEAAPIRKESWHEIAIIGISMAPDTFITDAFVKAGALAVVLKDQVDHLYSTIQQAFPKHRLLFPLQTFGIPS